MGRKSEGWKVYEADGLLCTLSLYKNRKWNSSFSNRQLQEKKKKCGVVEISTLILWGCLVLFVWCCGGFFVRGNHCHTLGCWIKWCSSWCIETQGAVVTSWICHRILGEVRMKNLFCCKCAFCCQCEHGERTKRIRKVSYWAKAKEVWDNTE